MISDAISGALQRAGPAPLTMQLCEIVRGLIVSAVPHDVRLGRDASALNIIAQSLASMTVGTPARSGLILGYGGAHDQEVRERGTALARLIAQAVR